MFRTLAAALQEGKVVVCTSKLSATQPFHVSRRCFTSIPAQSGQHVVAASGDSKKSRKRKTAEKKKKEAKPVPKSVLQESKLRHQLTEFERPGQTITVADVERYRPSVELIDPTSSLYVEEHKKLSKPLEMSFTKEQLVDILKLYEIQQPAGTQKKRHYASLILEKWGWPLPDSSIRKMTSESFPLKPSEAFFLMHNSQTFVKWSRNRAVKLSFTQQPLSLNAKGPLPLIREISAHVKDLRQDITRSKFSIPIDANFSRSMLKAISTSCGTWVEAMPDSQVSISYPRSRPTSLVKAQRAVLKAAYTNEVSTPPPLFYHKVEDALNIVEEPLYSVLPFSPVETQWLPKEDTPTYRIACVNGPISGIDQIVPICTDSLATLNTLDSTKFDLQKWLHDVTHTSTSKVVVKASPGHVLMEPVDQKTFSLSSPLHGQLDFNSVMNWARNPENYRHAFHPCVPKSINGFQTNFQDSSQRLEYSAVSPGPSGSEKHIPIPTSIFRCRIGLHGSGDVSSTSGHISPESFHLLLPIPDSLEQFLVKCETGWTSELDVMIPDRPTDLRFTASLSEPLSPEKYPIDLKNYALQIRDAFELESFTNTRTKPDPPLSIFYDGRLFVLTSFSHIRENRKESVNETGIATAPFEVVIETVVDTENTPSYGYSTCQISCERSLTDVHWDRFLRHCDWLTRGVARSILPPLFEEDFSGGL